MRLRGEHLAATSSTTSRRSKSMLVELELARLDLREVEDVVDDRQQRLAGGAERLGVVALLARRARVSSSSSVIPITPFMRRADLVAHVGQELRLDPRGATARRTPAGARRRRWRPSRWRRSRPWPSRSGKLTSMKVCSPDSRAYSTASPVRSTSASPRRRDSASSAEKSSRSVLAQHVAHAGRLLPGAADQQVAAVEVLHGDARGGVLEDPLQAVGRDAQALLRAPLVGDVHARVDDVRDRAVAIEQAGARPPRSAGPRRGSSAIRARRRSGTVSGRIAANSRLHRLFGSGGRERVPGPAAEHVLRCAAGQALARAVEREDGAFAVEDEDERPRRVDAGGEDVALGFQCGLAPPPARSRRWPRPRKPVTAPARHAGR